MPASILGRAIVLVAIPSLVLVALLAAFSVARRREAEAQRSSLQTRSVLDESQRLLTQLVDAQAGFRGFLIARDAAFLVPYREVRGALPKSLASLRSASRDNPRQHARVAAVARHASDMLAYYARVIESERAGALTPGSEREIVLQGRALTEGLRQEVAALRDEEQRLDDVRRDVLLRADQRLLAVVVGGAGAALFAVMALGVWFHRGISIRVARLTDTARALATGHEAQPDPVMDELAPVDVALHEMAVSLASRQRAVVSALADAVTLFSAAGSRGAVLEAAADRALALSGAAVSLCTVEGDLAGTQQVIAAVAAPGHLAAVPAPGTSFEWDAAREVMRTGRPVHVTAEARHTEPAAVDVQRVLGTGDWIGVPLDNEHSVPVGVLHVASHPGQSFRPDDGDVLGMLAQAASVALELERSRQRLESVNADLALTNQENELFIYSVSHDLRSPLVNLEGFSRELTSAGERLRALLREPDVAERTCTAAQQILDEDVGQSVHFIRVAVGRLASIIDGLLRLSRAGRVEYRLQSLSLDRIVQRVVDAMHSTLGDVGGEVHIGPLPQVRGDALAVEQLFANLIGNAVSYARPGVPPRIDVAAEDDLASSPKFTVVRVSDNGLGIAETHIDKVFQPLQRLHPGIGRGEGMGLAIVRRIVERHEGRVWVRSMTGAGSTFYVELPRDTPGGES